MFKNDRDAIQLAWDGDDAKLTFLYGNPGFKTRFHLWLSREHAWHPFRLQRFFLRGENGEKLFHDEWEVTRFVNQGDVWRVAEGTIRTRTSEAKLPPEKIKYSHDFKILRAKYGDDVDEKQFHYEIPKDAVVDDDSKPKEEPSPPAKTVEVTFRVVDLDERPVPEATIRLRTRLDIRELDRVTTDVSGTARSAKVPADDASITVEAENYRPATWIFGETDEMKVILAPQTAGVTVDESDEPVAGAWISNRPQSFRADGFYQLPRQFQGRGEDWSGGDGRFVMSMNLTLRRTTEKVPFIAIDPEQKRMAIQVVPTTDLGRQLELTLQPVCAVKGNCLLEGVTETIDIRPSVQLPPGETVAYVTARRELTSEGLRIDYQLRLPPGDYVLKAPRTAKHAEMKIPFGIARGENELDLGTAVLSPDGPATLKGKPAPDLAVQWRPSEETDWAKLRGKIVVLDFWSMWCGPCIEDMPEVMELADQFKDKPVAWIAIHTDGIKDFADFDERLAKCAEKNWNKRKPPFTLVLDRPLREPDTQGESHQRYGIAEWSTLIVVDLNGKVGPVQKKNLGETIMRLLDDK